MVLNQAWSLLLVTTAAAVLPGISRLIRLPAMVLQIIFGIILGKSFFNLDLTGEWLTFLAQLGFLLLMFQAGMEIDFSMLRKQRQKDLFLQVLIFIATFGLALVCSFLLGQGIFMAFVLSTTSLGLIVPALKETNITRTSLGQSILLASTLADFLSLFGITFFILGHQFGLDWKVLSPIPLLLGFGLFLKAGRLWAWWHPEKAARILGPEDSQELGVRLSLALLFLFVALSELVHLEPVLGAFMGGTMLSFVFREKYHLENKLSGMSYGFLIPLFFINVGMQFDLNNILNPEQILFTLKLLVLAFLIKLLPSMLFILQGIPFRNCFNAGVLLSSRLSLIIAAAAIGAEEGLIRNDTKDAIILLALLTCLIAPSLFKMLHTQKKIQT
jgi:Kef-type K+ transport system membrane component KefB